MNVAYTSKAATNAIAARAVREAGRVDDAPLVAINDALEPVSTKLWQRGKLTRNELRPIFNELASLLRAKENVSDLHTGVMSNSRVRRLSANESCRLRFIQTVESTVSQVDSDEIIERVLAFAAQDLQLSRHALRVRVNMTGFHVHPHVLSRYMLRMQKPHRDLLKNIMRPMYVSAILGHAIGDGGIMLPVHGGILLGRVTPMITTEIWPKVTVYDKNGPSDFEGDDEEKPADNDDDVEQIVTNIGVKTFIDTESLGNMKAALRAQIVAWEAEHANGIRYFFDHHAYSSTLIAHDEDPEITAQYAQNAFDAAIDLINSEAWNLVFDRGERLAK